MEKSQYTTRLHMLLSTIEWCYFSLKVFTYSLSFLSAQIVVSLWVIVENNHKNISGIIQIVYKCSS